MTCVWCINFWFVVKIDEDQCMYNNIMSEEVDMDIFVNYWL